MKKVQIINILLLVLVAVWGCKTQPLSSREALYIEVNGEKESLVLEEEIKKYRGDMDVKMSQVVGYSSMVLEKGKPNAPLGNYLSDLMMKYAYEQLNLKEVDAAIFNNGGFRIPLPGDSIRVGTIFELMPFENELVWVELPGDSLYSMANYLIIRGGEPVSENVELQSKSERIIRFLLNGKEIEKTEKYQILTSDYLASGGDNMSFFRGMKVTTTGVKLRDAIIESMLSDYKAGKKVYGIKDERIVIEP